MRCLKRYRARQVYRCLLPAKQQPPATQPAQEGVLVTVLSPAAMMVEARSTRRAGMIAGYGAGRR